MRAALFSLLLACLPFVSTAQTVLDSLQHLLRTAPPDTNRVNALNALASRFSQIMPDSTITIGSRAAELAGRLDFKPGQAQALKNIGYGHEMKEEYAMARSYFERSLELWRSIGDKEHLADLYHLLGSTAQQQGDFPEAIKQYLAKMRLVEAAGDTAAIADLKSILGNVNNEMGHAEESLALQREALTLFETLHDTLGIARVSNNLGTTLDVLGRYKEALTYLDRALHMARKLGNPMGEAICLGSLANHYQRMEDFEQALKSNLEVIALFERIGDPFNLAAAHINTGEILSKLERPDEAREHLNKGVELARSIGAKQWLANAHLELSMLAEAQGDAAEGLKQFKVHIAYRDSITNEANTRKAVQEQMQYTFDKKEAATQAEQEKKDIRQRNVRNSLMLGLALMIVFSGVFFDQRNRIAREKERSEELLLNILPEEVAEELKAKGEADAKQIDQVTVLFTEFKVFTAMSEKLTAKELVADIHECFSAFDHIMAKHGIEKIKTIGDAYMAAGGLPTPNTTHALDVVKAAFEISDFIAEGKARKVAAGLPYFEIRIGIHTGPVVAGIVGVKKFAYDIWGDTVNTASRMESSGEVGQVNVSESTYALVKDEPGLSFISRGKVQAKGKGEMEMYFVGRA